MKTLRVLFRGDNRKSETTDVPDDYRIILDRTNTWFITPSGGYIRADEVLSIFIEQPQDAPTELTRAA